MKTIYCHLYTFILAINLWTPSLANTPSQSVKESSLSLASGAKVSIPDGFQAYQEENAITLIEPDKQISTFLIEFERSELSTLIDAAWNKLVPHFDNQLDQSMSPPPPGDWDDYLVKTYIKNSQQEIAQAIAKAKGDHVWVLLIRGPEDSLDKRKAQIMSFWGSLTIAGMPQEDLSQHPVTSIASTKDELDTFITEVIHKTQVPGLAVAIVEGSKVVFAKGYGVKELGKSDKVNPDTLMMIGSVTKSLTTLMMASLIDEGKLAWTDKATALYPHFQLRDASLTQMLHLEDLVCACAGLPRSDMPLVLNYQNKTYQDLFSNLSTISPTTRFKETYQYQNQMVAAGGYIAAHAVYPNSNLFDSYSQLMRNHIFAKMQMPRSTLDIDQALADTNVAKPHAQDLALDHHAIAIDTERFAQYVGPSGSVWSSVNEMSKYLQVEINSGLLADGTKLYSPENLIYRRNPQVRIDHEFSYALGWVVSESQGLKLIAHNGGTMGFASLFVFYPEQKLGLVVLTNGTGGHLAASVLHRKAYEIWFSREDKSSATLKFALEQQRLKAQEDQERLFTPSSIWMEPFLGQHQNPDLGTMLISQSGQKFYATINDFRSEVKGYLSREGKRILVLTTPPLASTELVPNHRQELTITSGQEAYIFHR